MLFDDQTPFGLACGHTVVLGRLAKAETWKCEVCGEVTDLRDEPHRTRLDDNYDMADALTSGALIFGAFLFIVVALAVISGVRWLLS